MRWMSDFAPSLGRAGTHPGREPTGPPDAPSGPGWGWPGRAVGEQVAGGDLAGPPCRPHLSQRGNVPGDGASRSNTPRSASRIAAVAVTIFVIENHGHTMPGKVGTRAAMSASPAAWRPARPPARLPAPRRPAHPRLPAPGSARRRSRLPASAPPSAHSGVTRRVRPGQAPGRRRTCLLLRRAC